MANPYEPRVLVVDDEPDICDNLSDILTDLGYRVVCAYDGPSALELVRQAHFDVALLDLRMPGMDGLSLYREIKKIRAATMAILITAYAGGNTSEEAIVAGAWQVLAKPVQIPRLLNLVEQAQRQPLVLVVDDDRDLCENLWQILRERDYRVALAHDVVGVAEQVRDTAFQVVLIDMKLPGSDGGEVFRLVRESEPRARTVLVTGCRPEMDSLVERVLAEGADVTCYKPLDVPRLLETLDRLAKMPG
ncbi:response regulator [Singulisphaera rosea]